MYSDSHAHVDGFTDHQMVAVLADAKAQGVDIVLGVGTTLDQSQSTIDISRRFPIIVPAVGVHPWWASPADLEKESLFRSLASEGNVRAIGEVGIDLVKNPSTADVQWKVFELQLGLARDLNKPVLLHCKGARSEMQEMLRKGPSVRGVFHGFTGNAADAGGWLDLGLYIGIGVRSLTRNYTPEVEAAIRSIPLDRMLLETDASVRSFASEEALQPTKVIEVAEAVGRIHGLAPGEVGRRTTANLRALLGL